MKPEFRSQKSAVKVESGLWPGSNGAQCRRYNFAWLVLLLLSFGVATLHVQPYTLDWFTLDGGGGTSTGGVYSVRVTIGQPQQFSQGRRVHVWRDSCHPCALRPGIATPRRIPVLFLSRSPRNASERV